MNKSDYERKMRDKEAMRYWKQKNNYTQKT